MKLARNQPAGVELVISTLGLYSPEVGVLTDLLLHAAGSEQGHVRGL